MKWLEKDKYHIKSGQYIIAKYNVKDIVKYGLSFNNNLLGYFASLIEAKKKADSHASHVQ